MTVASGKQETMKHMLDSMSESVRSKLLFSLDDIDLSAVAADKDAIARINPHRGQMVLLDRLVWHSDGFQRGVGVKVAREDEFWVQGHFPGRPLFPGVLMIESSAQIACFLYNSRQPVPLIAAFTRLDDASFRAGVEPGQELLILCDEIKYSPRRFVSAVQGIVDGQIAFEAKITGMSLGEANIT
jgi:3-hydroxyacyl-[acyl-carrier-protein] dehydratase